VASNIEQSWQDIQVALRDRVGERTYGLWLAPLRCVGLDGDTLVLAGPVEISAWASSRYGGALREASAAVLGREVTVAVEADTERAANRLAARNRLTRCPLRQAIQTPNTPSSSS